MTSTAVPGGVLPSVLADPASPAHAPREPRSAADRALRWTVAVLLLTAPVWGLLLLSIWRSPFPISEAVALFEDAASQPVSHFIVPDTPYYRPLYHLLLMAIWKGTPTLDLKLALVKLTHILPVFVLVVAFVRHLRPRSALDAALAVAAVAVLLGSPGLRDNLELPLTYTAVGMPAAVLVWRLLESPRRRWTSAAIIALTVLAVGFKEQGLVIVPIVILAAWMDAPGATRRLAAVMFVLTIGYLAVRLAFRSAWPLFEQSLGFGVAVIEPTEAVHRFGAFPLPMYAYNALATMANVVAAEPSGGTFVITRDLLAGRPLPWELVHVISSLGLSGLIAWWGRCELRAVRRDGWTPERRAVVLLVLAVAACGALSFNYSRDRLGGMAVPFYAGTGFLAMRWAATCVIAAGWRVWRGGALALFVLASGWELRAVGTLEWVRLTSERSSREWLMDLPKRRREFAHREVYLGIMESMVEQGTRPGAPHMLRIPSKLQRTFLQRP